MPKRTEYDTTILFNDNDSPFEKAEKMRHSLEEYTLTTEAICDLLRCNRKYIDDYIKPNVANLFIHAKQINWIASILNLGPSFANEHRSYYYFSKDSFMEYLQRVMICTRQTIRIDLMDYRKEGTSSELVMGHVKKGEFEQAIEYLNPIGRLFYLNALPKASSTQRKLTSIIEVKNQIRFEDFPLLRASSSRNNERFYRQAFVNGYIKVKLNGKSYFIQPSKDIIKWGISLSYEDYSNICYEKK